MQTARIMNLWALLRRCGSTSLPAIWQVLENAGDSPEKTYPSSFLHSKQKLFPQKNFFTKKFYHLIPLVCALAVQSTKG